LFLVDCNQLAPGRKQCTVEVNGTLISLASAVEVTQFHVIVAGFLKGPPVMRINGFQVVERSQRISLPAKVTLCDGLAIERVDIPWIVGQLLLSRLQRLFELSRLQQLLRAYRALRH